MTCLIEERSCDAGQSGVELKAGRELASKVRVEGRVIGLSDRSNELRRLSWPSTTRKSLVMVKKTRNSACRYGRQNVVTDELSRTV